MKRILLGLGVVGLFAAGCATGGTDLRAQASTHQRRADELAARGDYRGAEKEQRKADKLNNRAALDRTYQEKYGPGITNLPANEKRLDDKSYPDGELPNFNRPPEVRE